MPTLNHQAYATFAVILLLAANGHAEVRLPGFSVFCAHPGRVREGEQSHTECVIAKTHPGRLREGERLLEIQETPRPPHRRVRGGEQPLALLFLLLYPRWWSLRLRRPLLTAYCSPF